MFKEAILRYKWYALASVLLTATVVTTALLQPSYLKDVLTAVLTNDKTEIVEVGKLLLVIAGIITEQEPCSHSGSPTMALPGLSVKGQWVLT